MSVKIKYIMFVTDIETTLNHQDGQYEIDCTNSNKTKDRRFCWKTVRYCIIGLLDVQFTFSQAQMIQWECYLLSLYFCICFHLAYTASSVYTESVWFEHSDILTFLSLSNYTSMIVIAFPVDQ